MAEAEQTEVLALRQPAAWSGSPPSVDVIETHGALIFMAGDDVLKVKRAVRMIERDVACFTPTHAIEQAVAG